MLWKCGFVPLSVSTHVMNLIINVIWLDWNVTMTDNWWWQIIDNDNKERMTVPIKDLEFL